MLAYPMNSLRKTKWYYIYLLLIERISIDIMCLFLLYDPSSIIIVWPVSWNLSTDSFLYRRRLPCFLHACENYFWNWNAPSIAVVLFSNSRQRLIGISTKFTKFTSPSLLNCLEQVVDNFESYVWGTVRKVFDIDDQ